MPPNSHFHISDLQCLSRENVFEFNNTQLGLIINTEPILYKSAKNAPAADRGSCKGPNRNFQPFIIFVPFGSLILKTAASIVTFFCKFESSTVVESLLFSITFD